MPIKNSVDYELKIVFSICEGKMGASDFPLYVKEMWSHYDYYGFNELFDTRNADWSEFDFHDLFEVSKKASLLNTLDPNSKFAWVVLPGKQNSLTNFYKSIKLISDGNSRTLQSFFSKEEALRWLQE